MYNRWGYRMLKNIRMKNIGDISIKGRDEKDVRQKDQVCADEIKKDIKG